MTERTTDAAASEAALARYQHAMRRQRGVYYAILAVILAVIGIVVGIAWTHGEVANTTLHTVPAAPPTLPLQPPSGTLTEAWHATGEQAAIGTPQWGGTVVTFSDHTVGGRNARTGARTWSYTRSDRAVCTAAQLSGTTIAVYELHGNCDEVTALDSQTGKRRWTRTLDMDGMPINGRPNFQTTPNTLMATTSYVIYAIDPVSGYNRWTYHRTGCSIEHAALGTGGVLISQDCSTSVQCGILKYCGPGQQLMLRDPMQGNGDDSKPNADQIKWIKFGDAAVPAAADGQLIVIDPGRRRFDVLDFAHGSTIGTVPLTGAVPANRAIVAAAISDAELVWLGGRAYVVSLDPADPHWSVATAGPPTVSTSGDSPPSFTAARIDVPSSTGIDELDGMTGTARTFALPAPPHARSLVYPVGTGFLVTDPSGMAVYR